MNKSLRIISLALFSLSAHGADLGGVLQSALEKDPQLAAAKYNLEASKENKKQALANFLPQVNASWDTTRGSSDVTVDVPEGFDEVNIETPDTDTESWQVSLSQSIYNQGNYENMKQSRLQIALSKAEYDRAYQDFLIRVAQNYFNVLINIDSVRFAEAEQKAIQRQLDQAEQRYEVGLAAITDVHEARAQYDAARAGVIQAKNLLDDAREALFEVAQNYYESLNALPDDIERIDLPEYDLARWQTIALEQNPDLGIAKINAELAEINIRLQRSGHFPSVDLSVSHGSNINNSAAFRNNDPNSPDFQEIVALVTQENKSTSYNLSVSVPIFSGGRTHSLTKQARFQYKSSMESLDQANLSTIRNIRNAIHNVEAGWSSVQARQLAVVSAASAEKATTAGFEVGTRNIVEVLNAQRSLYQAQRDFSQAKYDYLMNVFNLKRAAGILDQDDLMAINRLLTVQ